MDETTSAEATDESRHSRAADMPSLNEAVVDATEVYPLGSSSGESARLQRQAEELAPDRAVLLDMSCVADPWTPDPRVPLWQPQAAVEPSHPVRRRSGSGRPAQAIWCTVVRFSFGTCEFESSSPDLVAAAATKGKWRRLS